MYFFVQDVKSLARYNAGLQCLPINSDDFFENWDQAKQILVEMATEGIKPDGITLINLMVSSLTRCGDLSPFW